MPAAAQAHPERTAGKQPVATGYGGAVASADLDASRAGIDVLKRGGNAIDAAVAVASTLGVTEPFVAGPGGGGYMVIYLARQHRVVVLDGRETCPATCRSDMFVDPATGKPLPFEQARRSGLSVGVPGMVATWSTAVQRFGKHSFARDLAPAIDVASRGFTVDANFVQQEQVALADLQTFSSSRSLFLTAEPASRCRSAARCAIRIWPARTPSWPATAPATCTTARSAPTSPPPSSTRRSCPAWPTSRSGPGT